MAKTAKGELPAARVAQAPIRRAVRLSVPAAEGFKVLLLRKRHLEEELATLEALIRQHAVERAAIDLDDGEWTLDLERRRAVQR